MAPPSKKPHRRLRSGMEGDDIRALQRALNLRASRKGLGDRVKVDGEFGPQTLALFRRVAFLIGLGHRMPTVKAQEYVRWPWRRPARVKRRAAKRYDEFLADRRGPEQAIAWADQQWDARIREVPAGSNGGPRISDWQSDFGFGRVPWCGVFVGKALIAAGVRGITSRVAAVAFIEDDARAGRNGFRRWLGKTGGRRGDAVVIGGRGIHVEIIAKRRPWGYVTYGGNTSYEGVAGSQSNGGCVAVRNRSWLSVYGCARPAY
jgi:hypothetical protein